MASGHSQSDRQGRVKDPEHDGRLKENREAGRTKGTTPGSEMQAEQHGREPERGALTGSQGSTGHKSESHHDGSHETGHAGQHASARGSGSDDLKSREYRDEKGEVHHHTRTYQEQHGKE